MLRVLFRYIGFFICASGEKNIEIIIYLLQFTGNGPCEVNSVQKTEHEKNLEHSKKRSRPLLLRPVSGPAKVSFRK